MAGIDSLDTLLEQELRDTYDAEKQLTKALPKLAKKATAEALKTAFEQHLRQTEQHIERLEQLFEALELPVKSKKCDGMRNLIKEGDDMLSEAEDDATRDALMIASAQKVEHYEIAAYGTMRTWASVLGHGEVAQLLEETLEEEKETDRNLTEIAEAFVNQASAEERDEEEPQSSGRQMRNGRVAASRGGRQKAADWGSGRSRGSSRAGSSRSRSR